MERKRREDWIFLDCFWDHLSVPPHGEIVLPQKPTSQKRFLRRGPHTHLVRRHPSPLHRPPPLDRISNNPPKIWLNRPFHKGSFVHHEAKALENAR